MFACLHQAFAYRLVALGEATIFLWTNKRWLMSVIAARWLLETTALIHYVVRGVENAVDAKDAAKLHEIVMQQTFSQKTGDHGLPATHILKAVDGLTRLPPAQELFTIASPSTRIPIQTAITSFIPTSTLISI